MAVAVGAVPALRTAARSGPGGPVALEAMKPAVPADDPDLGVVHTARVIEGLIAALRAQPRTCLLPVLTGVASAGLACADDIRSSQETA